MLHPLHTAADGQVSMPGQHPFRLRACGLELQLQSISVGRMTRKPEMFKKGVLYSLVDD